MGIGQASYTKKISDCLRRATSDIEHEVVAATLGLKRVLEKNGKSFHDIADDVERAANGGVTDDELKKIIDKGVANGKRQAEGERYRGQRYDDTSKIEELWSEAIEFCEQKLHQLHKEEEHRFMDGMINLLRDETPKQSPRQISWFFSLLRKLGGSLPRA
jgi:hypothetical protein